MKRLSIEEWKNIFNNLKESNEEVEIIWLDSTENQGEYCLCFNCELFEDGFKTEQECYDRLEYLMNQIKY